VRHRILLASVFAVVVGGATLAVALPSHSGRPSAVAIRRLGPVPAAQRVAFALLLRLPGEKLVGPEVAATQNPSSPDYLRVISPRAFGRRFGLSRGRLARLEARLKAAGIAVLASAPQRTQLDVVASAATVTRTFGVRLGEYRDGTGHRFQLAQGPVRLPVSLAGEVDAVTGLDTRPVRIAHDVPVGGLTPSVAASAYDVNALHRAGFTGRGQTVAIISFSAYDPQDPATFALNNRLGGPTPQVVPVDGGTTDTSGAIEADLDIDVIRELAPDAQILVYEGPQTTAAYADMINRIVADGHTIISSSWGQCELGLDPDERLAESRALSAAVLAGVSMFVATGDAGAYDCQQADLSDHRLSVDWPASSADAIAVGGTRLYLGQDDSYVSEAAWEGQLSDSGGGGGVSTGDARPAWQTGPGVIGVASNGRRQVPDVSADADPGTPWAIYAAGGSGSVGGTSAATPFWAAAMTLIHQYAAAHGVARLGYVNPTLYALAAGQPAFPPFHDVTRGGNRYYQAAPGWDAATGLGSPDVFNLARDMVAYLQAHPAAQVRRRR
jgi:subtilase family serine protease